MHPYMIKQISDQRIADMIAEADSFRLARTGARLRGLARRRVSRHRISARRVPAQPAGWSSPHAVEHPGAQDDARLVSVGRAGSDDCR